MYKILLLILNLGLLGLIALGHSLVGLGGMGHKTVQISSSDLQFFKILPFLNVFEIVLAIWTLFLLTRVHKIRIWTWIALFAGTLACIVIPKVI